MMSRTRATCRLRLSPSPEGLIANSRRTIGSTLLQLPLGHHRRDGGHGTVGGTALLGRRRVLLGFLRQFVAALFAFGHGFSPVVLMTMNVAAARRPHHPIV